jgi:hypothetical protein
VCHERLELGAPRIRHLSGESLVEDTAERVHVRGRADRAFDDELGSKVVSRPRELGGFPRLLLALGGLRQTEVGEVDVFLLTGACEQHVRRLHVPVHEPALVCSMKPIGDPGDEVHRPCRLERTLFIDQSAQVRSIDEAHRDIELTFRLSRLVDRDDVRMIDRRREPGLEPKALAEARMVGELRR